MMAVQSTRPLRLPSLLALLALGLACRDGTPSKLERFVDAYTSAIDEICKCVVPTPAWPDLETCRDFSLPPYESADQECVEDVYARPEFAAYVECRTEAYERVASCLMEKGSQRDVPDFMCADGMESLPGGFRCDGEADCEDGSDEVACEGVPPTCGGQFNRDLIACGDHPPEFIEALDPCWITFTCSDGVEILDTHRCDGETDCPDGSDEVGC